MNLPSGDLDEIGARVTGRDAESLRGRRLLITGGSGFVGRWLVESFCRMNVRFDLRAEVAVLTRSAAGLRASAPHIAADPAVTLIEGDLHALGGQRTNPPFTRCDDVIHAATETSETLAREHPGALLAAVQGTFETLEFATSSGASRFLYLSSGAVYGAQPGDLLHVPEEFRGAPDSLDPRSAYAESKRMGELLCASFAGYSRLEVVVARGFAFVGPGLPLNRNFAAGNFLGDALQGNPIEVRGDGTPVRSFLYAGDLAWWLWILLLRGRAGRAYNVGSEVPVTIGELAREAACLGKDPVPVRIAEVSRPEIPPQRYVPSTVRARSELGLEQTVDWREGLRRTYEWYRQPDVSNARLGRAR